MSNSTLRYSTMRTSQHCGRIWEVSTIDEVIHAIENARDPIIVGGGSNILFTQDVPNDLIAVRILGRSISKVDERSVELQIGAGEEWHKVVLWTLENGWGGIENLSLIPGLCGAAPMQNIGAYGVELSDVLSWVEVLDRETLKVNRMSCEECKLGYRDSIFKNELKNRVVITRIGLKLSMEHYYETNTSYGAIEAELGAHNITDASIEEVSNAVISIRQTKLPDPSVLANNGSFFKNPILDQQTFSVFQDNFPDVPFYRLSESEIKIPAGWLIDNAGLKGKRIGDVGTHKDQALVIVNYGSAKGAQILTFARMIQKVVKEKYGIEIAPEVNIYPS